MFRFKGFGFSVSGIGFIVRFYVLGGLGLRVLSLQGLVN